MSSELEDLQSSRKRFGLEHREGDLSWSLTESEGRKEKAECHLRRGDTQKEKLSVICVEVIHKKIHTTCQRTQRFKCILTMHSGSAR